MLSKIQKPIKTCIMSITPGNYVNEYDKVIDSYFDNFEIIGLHWFGYKRIRNVNQLLQRFQI